MEEEKKHFVLVHGACHGAWCWYKLETLLRSAGHRVTSLDMAASGINPRQHQQVQSLSDYFEPLIKFMESLPSSKKERVILVGHSHGGHGISKAMEIFPEKISVAVFLNAHMPSPIRHVTKTIQEKVQSMRRNRPPMDNQITRDQGPENPPTSFNFGPNYMATYLYQLCSPEDLTLATRLVRQIRMHSEDDTLVSPEKYGSVSRAYLFSDEDKLFPKDLQLWIISNNPPNEVKEIPGSDHMAMLSRPNELFACLQEVAQNYA